MKTLETDKFYIVYLPFATGVIWVGISILLFHPLTAYMIVLLVGGKIGLGPFIIVIPKILWSRQMITIFPFYLQNFYVFLQSQNHPWHCVQ